MTIRHMMGYLLVLGTVGCFVMLGRTLTWDPGTGRVVGDDEANTLLLSLTPDTFPSHRD